jgi:hypothetical protein
MTIVLKQHSPVVDENDNAPSFVDATYRFSVNETSKVGETLFTSVSVKDLDDGTNSVVTLSCVTEESPEACDAFEIKARVCSAREALLKWKA